MPSDLRTQLDLLASQSITAAAATDAAWAALVVAVATQRNLGQQIEALRKQAPTGIDPDVTLQLCGPNPMARAMLAAGGDKLLPPVPSAGPPQTLVAAATAATRWPSWLT